MFRQLQSPLADHLALLERSEGKDIKRVQYVIDGARELLHIIELHFIV